MHIGDHLLYINSVNVRGLGADQVGAILRQQFGHQLRLIVARPVVNAAAAQQTLSSPSNSSANPSATRSASTSASAPSTAPTALRRFVSEGASAPDSSCEGPFVSPHAPLLPTAQLDETARMIAHSPDFYRALLLQQQLVPDAPPLDPQDTVETAPGAGAGAAPPNAGAALTAASDPMAALKANSVCL